MTNKAINIQTVQINATGNLNATIGMLLREMGVPASIKGYRCLKEAIELTVYNPAMINAVTGELYPRVAVNLGTTASRVERSIRHAIEVAWSRGSRDFLDALLGSSYSRTNTMPTNSEAIAALAEYLNENHEAQFSPLLEVDE